MPELPTIRRKLAAHQPTALSLDGKRQAAVAVVLRERDGGPEVLFIERATHPGDPWSGHMAFPGGRVDSADRDARRAAVRETREEVGLSLEEADYLGRLDDLEGRNAGRPAGLVISAYVFHLSDPGPLVLNHEVEEAFWFPVASLLERERHVSFESKSIAGARFPGILVGRPERHVVWGLTYRFLELFLHVAGRPLPERWREFGPMPPA